MGSGNEASVDVYTSSESPPNTRLMFSKSTECPFTAEMMSPAQRVEPEITSKATIMQVSHWGLSLKFVRATITTTITGRTLFVACKKKVQLLDSRHTPCKVHAILHLQCSDVFGKEISFSWFVSTLSGSKLTCNSAVLTHTEHKIEIYTIMASEAGPKKPGGRE